jgi:hypothetical protein
MGAALAAALAPASGLATSPPAGPLVEVWKRSTCLCCAAWVKHMEAAGFRVKVNELQRGSMSSKLGIPPKLASCHSARVDGYVLEGHVPAQDVRQLLATRPKALGLAVPGMPIGSPGMDGPDYDNQQDPYDVLLVQADGSTRVFNHHPGRK